MTETKIREVMRLKKQLDRMYQKNYTDFYYRYQGKTYIKKIKKRDLLRTEIDEANIIMKYGIDPDVRPVMFALSGDDGTPIYENTVYQLFTGDDFEKHGIDERIRKQWLNEGLTTAK